MRTVQLNQDAWQEVIPASELSQTFAVEMGIALVMFGSTDPGNPAQRLEVGGQFVVVPSGIPLFARADTNFCIGRIGDFGTVPITPAPAPQPPTDATVSNGQTLPLLPATGTTPAQGNMAATVADNDLTLRLAANRTVVASGVSLPVQNSAGATIGAGAVTVSGNAVQHVRLPANIAGVANGAQVQVDGAPVTLAVAAGALTGGTLAATAAVVTNGNTVQVGGQPVTLTVAGNNVTGGALPGTAAVVTNGQTLAVDGGSVVLSVAGGVVSAAFTPAP